MSTLFCPTSVKSEECHAIEGWSAKSSFQVIKEERDGHYICSISGYIGKDPLISDEGAWNCRLESSSYQHDQEYFDVVLLRPAKVSTTIDHKVERADRGSNAEMFVTDVAEISCTAEDALPKPKIQWLLNNNIIDFNSNVFSDRFRLIESEGPSQRQQDSWYQVQKISYIADSRDNDKVLQCQVEQVDDQGDIARQSNGNAKYTLFIKSIPPLDAMAIGSISGVIIILILALLLLGFAWHTRRWCFASPKPIVVRMDMEEGGAGGFDVGSGEYMPLLPLKDDQVNQVTKYQTHLIMLANRLAENPDSKDTADQTNSLARETANLMKNMASHEENILVKNRFLDAAKGLTDSVGELLTASEHCSARPGDGQARHLCQGAAHQVHTQAAESVTIVKTILILRQLEAAARQAVAAAKHSLELAKDINSPKDLSDLSDLITQLNVVTQVLEERIENFAESPSLADSQSYLVIASKRFLPPAEK